MRRLVLGLLFSALTLAASARARETAGDDTSKPSEMRASMPRPNNLGLRGMSWSSSSAGAGSRAAGLGIGIDYSYLLNPYFGLGGQILSYSDLLRPEYHALDLSSATTALAFAEGRYPLLSFLAPYARGGAGLSSLTLVSDIPPGRSESRAALSLSTELGLELHYRVSLRLFVEGIFHPGVSEAAVVQSFGAELGGRF
ncbi:MAG TPA: outer membrane beta-barrel protein [Polyangiaceae bacterium]|jgi:hypothetical protein